MESRTLRGPKAPVSAPGWALRFFALGLAFAFCAGAALGGDPDTYQSSQNPRPGTRGSTTAVPIDDWWWPFGRSELKAARGPVQAAKAQTPPGPGSNSGAPSATVAEAGFRPMNSKEVSAQLNREMETYLRRLAVCDRVKQVAEETHDPALEAHAELMQQRAWMLCQQRMGQLRMPGLLPEKETDAETVLTADKRTPARSETKSAEVKGAPIRSVRAGQPQSSQEKE